MTIRRIEDIERESLTNEREQHKEQAAQDIVDVFDKIKNKREARKIHKPDSLIKKFLVLLLYLGILLFLMNFLLWNVYAFKWVIKALW